jgi:predicted transcriptional regulator
MPYKIDPRRIPRSTECPSGSVQCLVCGRPFYLLGKHLRTHGLTARTYRERFPGAATVTIEARQDNALRLVNARARIGRSRGERQVTYAVTT